MITNLARLILAGALGGVASAYGMIGPFTRLMMAISASSGATQDVLDTITKDHDAQKALLDAATFVSLNPITFGIPTILMGLFFQSEKKVIEMKDGTKAEVEKTSEEKNAENARRAMIASGALEAMMMMAFMKNPGSMQMIGELIGSAKSGAGALLGAL